MKKFISLLACSLFFFTSSFGNNIQISNVGITGQNIAQHYSFVKFDISWENSWRLSLGPANWDAAWVFIKYRVNNGDWNHARLNYIDGVNDGHVVPAGVAIKTKKNAAPWGLGVLLHRSADGSGHVNWQNIQLRWNYGSTGVNDNDIVDIQVFAIEMVYVPEGSFYVGDGTTFRGSIYTFPTTSSPYYINSEMAINVGTTDGYLYYDLFGSGIVPGDQAGPIPAGFPKGFKAFYCMKYELSQDQWVSFFNTLNNDQKLNRDITDATHKNSDEERYHNTIAWSGTGNATTQTPNRPANYLSWNDAMAYMDWAALRPMTELEFEKACRGPLKPVSNEYAWGTKNIFTGDYVIINDGQPNENISNPATGVGNASNDRLLRSGIFASSALNKNREETGGTFYGIMEMSGNLAEFAIGIGSPEGRTFTNVHGDGVLNYAGGSSVAEWPFAGLRGGTFINPSAFLMISWRSSATGSPESTYGGPFNGAGRGVRSDN